jgi:hypothetical protein
VDGGGALAFQGGFGGFALAGEGFGEEGVGFRAFWVGGYGGVELDDGLGELLRAKLARW